MNSGARAVKQKKKIYINADKGYEEDIMLLLYSDGGTLTK